MLCIVVQMYNNYIINPNSVFYDVIPLIGYICLLGEDKLHNGRAFLALLKDPDES